MLANHALLQQIKAQPFHQIQQSQSALLLVRVIHTENGTDGSFRCPASSRCLRILARDDLVENIGRLFLGRLAVRQSGAVYLGGPGLGRLLVLLLLCHRQNQLVNRSLCKCFQLLQQNNLCHT